MVSSVLAQAILSQKTPNIVGSFREGQEISRQGKVKELSSLALKEGGGESLDQLIDLVPEVGLALGEHIGARSAKDLNDFIASAKIGLNQLNNGDVPGFISFGEQRIATLKQQGRNTTQTEEAINLAKSGDVEGARQRLQGLVGSIDLAKQPSSIVERDRLLKDLESPDENVRRSAEIALKLSAPARAGLSSEEQVNLARDKAMARAEVELGTAGDIERLKAEQRGAGKGISERQQGFIDSGVTAADSTKNIKRSLEILDTVKTGGFAAAAQSAKQFFGVEGADEGELTANLGIAVLSQLKPIFGAAFTKEEASKLEGISAGFGKNATTNRRLLNNALTTAERAAKRAIRAAEDAGDDFTANEIRMALEAVSESSGQSSQSPQAPQKTISVDF